jgi:phospholipid/cholesterol/gamma-HCH transport system ATP-binding protein
MSDIPYLELRDIDLSRGSERVLRNLNATIWEGQTTVVIGPSGCGKSLFLKISAGILLGDQGVVRYRGRDLTSLTEKEDKEYRASCGFVFQDSALWSDMNLLANFSLPLEFHHPEMTREAIRRRIDRLCTALDFRENLAHRPAQLSTGERRQASIIRALVLEPKRLFLDDPLGGLDRDTEARVIDLLGKFRKEGRTLIIATHDTKLTALVADKLFIMDEGAIVGAGPAGDLMQHAEGRAAEILTGLEGEAAAYDQSVLDMLEGADGFGG